MDYKDLNKAFKANEKIISELLEKYANRYNTKTNQDNLSINGNCFTFRTPKCTL